MSDYELHHGDMLEVMPTLAKGSVAMVFADLPYGVTANGWDSHINLSQFWDFAHQVCIDSGALVTTAQQPFTTMLINSNAQRFRYDLVWEKGRSAGIFAAKKRPLRSHESLLIFYRLQPTYHAQMLDGGTRYATLKAGILGKNYKAKYTPIQKANFDGKMFPRSVLPIKCVNNRQIIHPTQKPVALLEWLIATYTNPGDTVLDPVFGSGTTGVACANLGRKFVGIEKDAGYFATGKSRIEKAYADAAVGPRQASLAV